jgi:hypothetical protein
MATRRTPPWLPLIRRASAAGDARGAKMRRAENDALGSSKSIARSMAAGAAGRCTSRHRLWLALPAQRREDRH